MIRRVVTALAVAGLVASSACDGNSCQEATDAMTSSITAVCGEGAFANTPFCQCCVPAGLFSIDDTCACKPLILDVDFCYYKEGTGGYPAIRAALDHASSVCSGRPVTVPYSAANDGGMCVPSGAM